MKIINVIQMSTDGKINAKMKLRILKDLRSYILAFGAINECIGGKQSPGIDLFLFMLKPIEMKFIDWYQPLDADNNHKNNMDRLISTGIYDEEDKNKEETKIVINIGKRMMTIRLFHGQYTQADRQYHEKKIRSDVAGIFAYMFYAYKWKLMCNNWHTENKEKKENRHKWFYTYSYMYRQYEDSSIESETGQSDQSGGHTVAEIHNRIFTIYRAILKGDSTLANHLYDNTVRFHAHRITERLFFLTNVAQVANVDVNKAHRVLLDYESEFSVTSIFCLGSILYKFLEKPVFLKDYQASTVQAGFPQENDTESDSNSDSNHSLDSDDQESQLNRNDDTESDNDSDSNTRPMATTTAFQKEKQINKRKQPQDPNSTQKKYRTKIFGKQTRSMPFDFAKKLTMDPPSP